MKHKRRGDGLGERQSPLRKEDYVTVVKVWNRDALLTEGWWSSLVEQDRKGIERCKKGNICTEKKNLLGEAKNEIMLQRSEGKLIPQGMWALGLIWLAVHMITNAKWKDKLYFGDVIIVMNGVEQGARLGLPNQWIPSSENLDIQYSVGWLLFTASHTLLRCCPVLIIWLYPVVLSLYLPLRWRWFLPSPNHLKQFPLVSNVFDVNSHRSYGHS